MILNGAWGVHCGGLIEKVTFGQRLDFEGERHVTAEVKSIPGREDSFLGSGDCKDTDEYSTAPTPRELADQKPDSNLQINAVRKLSQHWQVEFFLRSLLNTTN